MKIRIQHRAIYRYLQPVLLGPHRVLVRPREGNNIRIVSSSLQIVPEHSIHWARDVNDNCIALIDFQQERVRELEFYSEIVLEKYDQKSFDFRMDADAVHYPFVYDPWSMPELTAFTQSIYPLDTSRVQAWLGQFWQPGLPIETMALLQKLNLHIHQNFEYIRRDTHGVQHPVETLDRNSGSCRDFATLFIEACRCWGLAARFVSGYMLSEATRAGGATTQAWAEVYLPGVGWKGFDPTLGVMVGSQHLTVAVSRHPEGSAPISGSYFGVLRASLGVEVNVKLEPI